MKKHTYTHTGIVDQTSWRRLPTLAMAVAVAVLDSFYETNCINDGDD